MSISLRRRCRTCISSDGICVSPRRLLQGKAHDLIWIQDWDFNWQDIYHYKEPLFLPAGSRVDLVAHFDNSVENPANPNDPPVPVGWGEKTTDEMCIGFFYYVKAKRVLTEIVVPFS